MDLSVVIPTWDNVERLEITLGALARCEVPEGLRWEVIVVNNRPGDAASRVVAGLDGRLPLRYTEEARRGISRARNRGLAAASGSLIVFADDDMAPCREWLVAYWAAYRERPTGYYFGGPIESEFESETVDWELLSAAPFVSMVGLDLGGEAHQVSEPDRLQSNWACPAAALARTGGFDTSLGLDASLGRQRVGEEFDLMLRLESRGVRPWYVPEARVRHFVPAHKCTLRHLAGRAEAQGAYAVESTVTLSPRRYPFVVPFLRPGRGPRAWADEEGVRIAGAPVRLYLEVGRLAARWGVARLAGDRAHAEYLSLRFGLGMVWGLRARRPRSAASPGTDPSDDSLEVQPPARGRDRARPSSGAGW